MSEPQILYVLAEYDEACKVWCGEFVQFCLVTSGEPGGNMDELRTECARALGAQIEAEAEEKDESLRSVFGMAQLFDTLPRFMMALPCVNQNLDVNFGEGHVYRLVFRYVPRPNPSTK